MTFPPSYLESSDLLSQRYWKFQAAANVVPRTRVRLKIDQVVDQALNSPASCSDAEQTPTHEAICQNGRQAIFQRANVADSAEMMNLVQTAAKEFGRLDMCTSIIVSEWSVRLTTAVWSTTLVWPQVLISHRPYIK